MRTTNDGSCRHKHGLAIVDGPSLDMGQQIMTYLFLTFLPIFILSLLYCVIPANPTSRHYLMAVILRGTPWRLRGTKGVPRQSHHKR
jgi:hypothetical protein